jgi:hypothetical protein
MYMGAAKITEKIAYYFAGGNILGKLTYVGPFYEYKQAICKKN